MYLLTALAVCGVSVLGDTDTITEITGGHETLSDSNIGLSGISLNQNDGHYYAIQDRPPVYHTFDFKIKDDAVQMSKTLGSGVATHKTGNRFGLSKYGKPDEAEGIVAMKGGSKAHFLVSTESEDPDYNKLFFYNNGPTDTPIDVTKQMAKPFQAKDAWEHNLGLEGLSVDFEQEYIAYATENGLYVDNPEHKDDQTGPQMNRVRISVNTYSISSQGDFTMKEVREFWYEIDALDSKYTPYPAWSHSDKWAGQMHADNGLTDIALFQNQKGGLMALVMERYSRFTANNNFGVKIYLVDLDMADSSLDVRDCDSLATCGAKGKHKLSKGKPLWTMPETLDNGKINYEGLGFIRVSDDKIYDAKDNMYLVLISDNGYPGGPTHFQYLKYHAPNALSAETVPVEKFKYLPDRFTFVFESWWTPVVSFVLVLLLAANAVMACHVKRAPYQKVKVFDGDTDCV